MAGVSQPTPDELRRWLRLRPGERAFAKAVPRTPAGLLLKACAGLILVGYLLALLALLGLLAALVTGDPLARVIALFAVVAAVRLMVPEQLRDEGMEPPLDLGRVFAGFVLKKLFDWEANPPEERVWADERGLVIQRGDDRREVAWSAVKGVRQIQGRGSSARERLAGRASTDLWALQIPGRDVVLNSDEGGAAILRTAQNVVHRRWRPTASGGATEASLSLSRMSGEDNSERGLSRMNETD